LRAPSASSFTSYFISSGPGFPYQLSGEFNKPDIGLEFGFTSSDILSLVKVRDLPSFLKSCNFFLVALLHVRPPSCFNNFFRPFPPSSSIHVKKNPSWGKMNFQGGDRVTRMLDPQHFTDVFSVVISGHCRNHCDPTACTFQMVEVEQFETSAAVSFGVLKLELQHFWMV